MNTIKELKIFRVFTWIIIGLLLIRFTPDEGDFKKNLSEKIKFYKEKHPVEYLFIHTDREVYSPGGEIHFKAYVMDFYSSSPSQRGKSLNLLLIDYLGHVVLDSPFDIKDSQAAGKLMITDTLPEGQYTLIGFTDFMASGNPEHVFTKELFISTLSFPGTIIHLATRDTLYNRGTEAEVEIRLFSPIGKPERKAFTYELFVNEESIMIGEGKTDKSGKNIVKFSLPEFEGTRIVSLEVSTKRSGRIDKNRIIIPVAGFPFSIEFYPEGGKLIHGIESKVGFIVRKHIGELPEIVGEVLDHDDNLLTNFRSQVDGMGYFTITPDLNNPPKVRITEPSGIDQIIDLPEVIPGGVGIKYMGKQDDHLSFEISRSNEIEPDELHIIAEQNGEIVWHHEFQEGNTGNLEIPLSFLQAGIVNVSIFSLNGIPLCYRTVYLNEKRELSVQLKTNQIEFAPKERITLEINALNRVGDLDIADLSVSVTDANINPDWNYSPDIITYSILGPGRSGYPFSPGLFIDPSVEDENLIDILMLTIHKGKFNWQAVFDIKNLQTGKYTEEKFLDRVLEINRLNHLDAILVPIENIQFINKHILKYNQVFPEYYMVNKRYLGKMQPARNRASQEDRIREMLESGIPILEVIRSIKNFQMMGNKIVFFGPNSLLNQDGALIVLDGIKMGTDVGLLKNINPIDIADIRVVTDPTEMLMYTGLNNVGIIDITSKSGKEEEEDQTGNIEYNPTLLWNPYVYTLKDRKITFSIESTLLKSSYNIVVQGFNEKGILLYKTKSFSVY